MPVRKIFFTILLIGCYFTDAYCQYLEAEGKYSQSYYSVNNYLSGAQTWCANQDVSGDMFFGSSTDIICFNGYEWKLIQPQKETKKKYDLDFASTLVGKIFRSKKGDLYVGRRENFGIISYNNLGEPFYEPLLVNESKESIGVIWNIFEDKKGRIFFFGKNSIFVYSQKRIKQIHLPKSFENFVGNTVAQLDNTLFAVYEEKNGRTSKYFKINLNNSFNNEQIGTEFFLPKGLTLNNVRGTFKIGANWYVSDLDKDLFEVSLNGSDFSWKIADNPMFKGIKSYTPVVIKAHGNHILLGTENNGLIIFNQKGETVKILNEKSDLEVNYVNEFFFDSENNIWLCLDNGIQYFEVAYPFTYFTKKEGVTSLIEAIDFKHSPALFGLHVGIHHQEKAPDVNKFIRSSDKQKLIFDLKTFDTDYGQHTLFIGNDSIYEFDFYSKKTIPICGEYGYILAQSDLDRNVIYVTLDEGVGKLTIGKNKKWTFERIIPQLRESTFNIVCFKHKLYFGVQNVGVYVHDILTKKTTLFKEKKKESNLKDASETSYYLELFQNQIYIGTSDGIAILDYKNKLIVQDKSLSPFFKKNVNLFHRIVNINNQKLFIINRVKGDKSGIFKTSWLERINGKWKSISWPFYSSQLGVIASLAKDQYDNVWFGTTSGLVVLNQKILKAGPKYPKIKFDKLLINEQLSVFDLSRHGKLRKLSQNENSFKVYFHLQTYSHANNNEYRYKLNGFNDQWSNWSNLNYANLEKVPEGTYTLTVQGKNSFGIASAPIFLEITILPPWYRTVWAYTVYIILLIFLVYLVVQLSTQRVKRQNQKLEEIVQQRTKEIAEQNHQLEIQKEEITAKTMDILDSIHYAKRIQSTILPTTSRLNELFRQHFVFYRPKDIVSGDFYWAREVQGKVIFSAVDCTGHGVPGALVSIVGNNGLLRAINEFKLTEPNDILNKLREIVIDAFRAEGQSDVKDGMDIALCSIDQQTGILKFSGANNECVIIRNGEIIELKPDKQPIGQFIDAKPFTAQEFQLQHGDCVYLYTDGYVDQFGGDRLKKFKSRPFKSLLATIYHLDMDEQYKEIQRTFDTWKHDVDQVDDVCVFAVKYINPSHES